MRRPKTVKSLSSMETKGICRIACATIVAATLVLMSACTIVPHQSPESQAFLASQNNVSKLAANDYINQCGEQIRLWPAPRKLFRNEVESVA